MGTVIFCSIFLEGTEVASYSEIYGDLRHDKVMVTFIFIYLMIVLSVLNKTVSSNRQFHSLTVCGKEKKKTIFAAQKFLQHVAVFVVCNTIFMLNID